MAGGLSSGLDTLQHRWGGVSLAGNPLHGPTFRPLQGFGLRKKAHTPRQPPLSHAPGRQFAMCFLRMPPVRQTLSLAGAVLLLGLVACQKPEAPATPLRTESLVEPAPVETGVAVPSAPVGVEVPSLAPLVDRILPTVVSVEVESTQASSAAEDEGEGPRTDGDSEAAPGLPEGHPPVPSISHERAGAGVLLSGRGLVLTSFHFVRDAPGLVVHLADGRTYEAQVVGRDAPTDLALLRLRNAPASLPVARLGDSRKLHTGDWVLAVGNPFGLASSVSLGIVSALARRLGGPYDEFLQTDAAINPGSSGGPLFDLHGEVVGIATAVPVAAGVGFAVPSSVVLELLPQLEKEGGVTRGALGALFQDMTPALGRALGVSSGRGALVSGFTQDSAAQRAGVQRDDVVVAVDGLPVASKNELIRAVALRPPASRVRVTLVRAGQSQEVQVTLGVRTDLEGTGPLSRPVPEERTLASEPGLGLELADLTREVAAQLQVRGPGAVVVGVAAGSVADAAGFVPGEVVTELGGATVRNARDAALALKSGRSGRTLLVRILTPGGAPGLRALAIP
jgi:serine protease Do